MKKNEWFVVENSVRGYIAARQKRKDEPLTSENIEYYGEYMDTYEECSKIVDDLNSEKIIV